jgi:hypothetical protein
VIDVSDPTSPTRTGSLASSTAWNVYVSGKYAYIGDGGGGFDIVNISDPTSPSLTGTYDTPLLANGVYVSGRHAYVGDGNSLQIIDVTDPSTPSLTGELSVPAGNLFVSGKYVYLDSATNGLSIVDISNPATPSLTGTVNTTGADDVYVSGKYVYVADSASGLRVIDIQGADIHAASIGNIEANHITVSENLDVGNSLYVRNGLNVGPGGLLVDEGEVTFDSSSGATAFTLNQRASGDIVNINNSSSEVFTILSDGSVGIGTSAPAGVLDVVGDEDIMLRAGLAAAEYNLAGNNDLWIAAEDRIELYGSGFSLQTSSTSVGELLLQSAGTLRLDTSGNNTDIVLRAGTGSFDVSSGTMLLHSGTSNLTLSSEGTVTIGAGSLVLSNLTTCSGLSNGGALTTDASGVVSCSADDSGGGGAFTDGGTYIYPTNSARRFIYSYEGVQTTDAFFEAVGDYQRECG